MCSNTALSNDQAENKRLQVIDCSKCFFVIDEKNNNVRQTLVYGKIITDK